MRLNIQFAGQPDEEIERRARSLANTMQGLTVVFGNREPLASVPVPRPYALFQGENQIREYGAEAVMSLLDDVASGAVR